MENKETLEEAAERYAESKSSNFSFRNTHIRDFKEGAKWQAERMYSEEDMIEFLNWSKSTDKDKSEHELKCLLTGIAIDSKVLFDIWFEQFKKTKNG